MCGIAGMLDWKNTPDAEVLGRMLADIRHRGPDDAGTHTEGPLSFGMQRLAIIDIAGGVQPMFSVDHRYAMVFNGQVYNYIELAAELTARGIVLQTHSDTEVLMQLLIHDGEAALPRLNGMFAFAFWDRHERRLLLARDRFGTKPLYFAQAPHRFAFASELKCLTRIPWVSREPDREAVPEYLQLGYIRSPRTLLRQVSKLPPGHAMTVNANGSRTWRYWHPDHRPFTMNEHDIEEALLEKLQGAIRLRQRSDVPIGAFLSGGIDSGMVVALLAEQSSAPVNTFTARFGADGIDEGPLAALVAKRYGTRHHEVQVSTKDALHVLPTLVWHLDEPSVDTAILPSYLISKVAAADLKVVLTGAGGDESFGGYTRYLQGMPSEHVYRRLPLALRRLLRSSVFRLTPPDIRQRAALNELPFDARFLAQSSFFSGEALRQVAGGSAVPPDFARELAAASGADEVNRLMAADLSAYLPEDIMHITDRMSMAVSLEAREPFLDTHLVDFMMRVPSNLKIDVRTRQRKILLQRLARSRLPAEIFAQPKQGFGGPVAAWMRDGLIDVLNSLMRDSAAVRAGLLDAKGLREYLALPPHPADRQRGVQLWGLLILEIWARIMLEGQGAAPRVTLEEMAANS
jgi:asparagine synthase (glutamine-hydrolysing)